ncbi:MAG: RnfABCDGE type electron transport complex subunit D [Candidatus Howiella sp.]|jgi:electron transport complex protein RnfD
MNGLIVSSSPHFRHRDTTASIMLDVLISLIPATLAGIVLFGPRAGLLILVCVASAVLAEYICCRILKKPNSTGDLSAAVTGLLLALCLPPSLPLWMGMLGSVIAIVIVKQLFGGLGQNFVNPAITGRIVLMVSFPTAMTTWDAPFAWLNSADAVTTATPLAGGSTFTLQQLLLGYKGGCIGETYALALLLGGIYLVVRGVITPVIPVCFIGTTGLLMWAFGGDPLFHILTGGLLLGAIFMATDYVTSPSTTKGKVIYAIGCGAITAVIRQFGSLPEGVSYSILVMNIIVPYINRLCAPKPFGWEGAKDE